MIEVICLDRDTMDENVDSLTFIKFGTDPGLQIVADCWLALGSALLSRTERE